MMSEKTDRKNEARRVPTGKLIPCPGEAHRNPFIDNCMQCAPRWGQIEELALLDMEAAFAKGMDVPVNELSPEQWDVARQRIKDGLLKMVSVEFKHSKKRNANVTIYNVLRSVPLQTKQA